MGKTFEFVFSIQQDEKLRKRIYELIESKEDEEFDIRGWRLYFDKKQNWVVITDNGTSDYLKTYFVPAGVSFDTLIHFMDPNRFGEEFEEKVTYLDNSMFSGITEYDGYALSAEDNLTQEERNQRIQKLKHKIYFKYVTLNNNLKKQFDMATYLDKTYWIQFKEFIYYDEEKDEYIFDPNLQEKARESFEEWEKDF